MFVLHVVGDDQPCVNYVGLCPALASIYCKLNRYHSFCTSWISAGQVTRFRALSASCLVNPKNLAVSSRVKCSNRRIMGRIGPLLGMTLDASLNPGGNEADREPGQPA